MNVTDEDRAKARRIVSNWLVNFGPNEFDPLQAMIVTYLAAEREKARAPFLALADELDEPVVRAAIYLGEWDRGRCAGEDAERLRIAARIRRALDAS